MKPLQIVRVDSDDGDTHFIFKDIITSEKNNCAQTYNEIQVREASKREASKPLNLKRTE